MFFLQQTVVSGSVNLALVRTTSNFWMRTCQVEAWWRNFVTWYGQTAAMFLDDMSFKPASDWSKVSLSVTAIIFFSHLKKPEQSSRDQPRWDCQNEHTQVCALTHDGVAPSVFYCLNMQNVKLLSVSSSTDSPRSHRRAPPNHVCDRFSVCWPGVQNWGERLKSPRWHSAAVLSHCLLLCWCRLEPCLWWWSPAVIRWLVPGPPSCGATCSAPANQ